MVSKIRGQFKDLAQLSRSDDERRQETVDLVQRVIAERDAAQMKILRAALAD